MWGMAPANGSLSSQSGGEGERRKNIIEFEDRFFPLYNFAFYGRMKNKSICSVDLCKRHQGS